MDSAVNYVTAVLCGLALLVAQYFVGRGAYPFLPLPAYGLLFLAALSAAWRLGRRDFAAPRWGCVSLSAALVLWIGIPLAGHSHLWLPGAILRAVLAAWIVYGLIVFVITGTRERFVLVAILLAGSFLQAAYGFLQYLAPDARPYLGWISALCPERLEGHAFRARGFYYNANHLAWLLNFAGVFALSIGVWGRVGLWTRLSMLYGAAMFFGSGILTQSRGGLIGAAFGLGVFLILSGRGLLLGAWGSRGRMLGMLCLALLVSLGAAWQAYEASDLAQFRILKAGEEGYRASVWKTALRLWQVEPLSGTGIGTFSTAARQYRFRTDAVDDVFVHNDWVQALAEIGLIGAGLGFCVLLAHLFSGWRAFAVVLQQRIAARGSPASLKAALQAGALSSLSAFAAHSFFDFNMQVPANALLACVSLAILASPGQRIASGKIPLFGCRLASAGTCAGAFLLLWLGWGCLRAEFAWIRAGVEFDQGNPERSLAIVESGLLSNPDHSGLAALGGRAALVLGKRPSTAEAEKYRLLERSVFLTTQASRLEPDDAWHFINIGHARDIMGQFAEAAPFHLTAISKAPYFATPYEFYALHLELSGSTADALRFYGLALHFPESTFSVQRREALLQKKN